MKIVSFYFFLCRTANVIPIAITATMAPAYPLI